MTVNNTLVTLSQLQLQQLTRQFLNAAVNVTPLFRFLKSPDVFKLWQPKEKLSQAKKAIDIEVSTGTTASRDSDGNPTGQNFNVVNRYENLMGMENLNAHHTIAFQDRRVLEAELETLSLIYNDFEKDMINESQLVERMMRTNYGTLINDKLVKKVRDAATGAFVTFLTGSVTVNAFDTETIYKSSAGTIWPNINIIASEFAEAVVDELLNLMVVEKDHDGTIIGAGDVKHMIIDNGKFGDAVRIIYPDKTVDSENRTLLNAMSGERINLVPAAVGNSNVFVFADGHGLECDMDSEDVYLTMETDENGNIVINADIAIGFMFKHGNRTYLYKK